MKSKVKEKKQIKTTSLVSFVFMFGTIAVLTLMLYNSKDASAAYKVKVSDLIESVVSNDTKAAGDLLKENKIQDAVDQLLTQTLDMLVRSGNYDVTEEQSQQIEQNLRDMLVTMTEQDLIEFTQDGELSTFSKYYLADAVAYAVTDAIGNDTITVNQDTIDNQFILDNLNKDVLDLRVKYEALANKYETVTGSKFDSNNFQEILNQYTILDKETFNQITNDTNGTNGTNGTNSIDGESPESILEMMLKIQALETMVKTLSNTEYNNTSETLTSETVIQLDTITREVERIKESMSNGDSPNPGDLYNISELTEALLKLSEKVNGMDLSGIDRNNASILIEIQDRQNAITQLKDQIKEITDNSDSTETKALLEKLESMTKELEDLKSEVTVQNTTNETNKEVWTKETNTKIESILKQIETIQGSDKTTTTTINNLKQTINTLQQTVNNIQSGESGGEAANVDLTNVYSSIADVKLQIMAGSDDPLETVFSNIAGDTVAAKIGSLSNELTAETENLKLQQANYELKVTNQINENIASLENSINSSFNTKFDSFNTQLNEFKSVVESGGTKEQIDAAKTELEKSIKDLQDQLTQTNTTTNTTIENNVTQLNNQLTELIEQINNVTENNPTLKNYIDNSQTQINKLYKMIDEDLHQQLEDTRTALQSNIDGLSTLIGTEDDMGASGEGLTGSLYEKLGSVADKVNGIKSATEEKTSQLSQGLADEQSARVASDSAIQNSLADLQGMMSKLEFDITNSSETNETNIDNTKSELLQEITNIYTEINNSSNNLEYKLSETIYKIEATNDWVTDIQLNLTPGSQSVYTPNQCTIGLQQSDNANYPDWNMWVIDQQKLAEIGKVVTFRAKNGKIPESDITIVYENAPVIVVKYKITDKFLYIYTPNNTPTNINGQDYINIQTMHVQNDNVTNEV